MRVLRNVCVNLTTSTVFRETVYLQLKLHIQNGAGSMCESLAKALGPDVVLTGKPVVKINAEEGTVTVLTETLKVRLLGIFV